MENRNNSLLFYWRIYLIFMFDRKINNRYKSLYLFSYIFWIYLFFFFCYKSGTGWVVYIIIKNKSIVNFELEYKIKIEHFRYYNIMRNFINTIMKYIFVYIHIYGFASTFFLCCICIIEARGWNEWCMGRGEWKKKKRNKIIITMQG